MRNNLHTFTPGDDIRYRGPLSYQWLQALGWFCIVVAAGRVLLKLGIKMDPVIAAEGPRFLAPMATIASLAVPFLMVAVFAQLMAGEVHYKKLLLIYGGLAAGVFLLSYGFFARYVAAPLGFLVKQPEYVMPVLAFTFRLLSASGFLSFNLFIDLFLYALLHVVGHGAQGPRGALRAHQTPGCPRVADAAPVGLPAADGEAPRAVPGPAVSGDPPEAAGSALLPRRTDP